jgi:hypothetical protein
MSAMAFGNTTIEFLHSDHLNLPINVTDDHGVTGVSLLTSKTRRIVCLMIYSIMLIAPQNGCGVVCFFCLFVAY